MTVPKPTMRGFRRDEAAIRQLSADQFRVTQRSGTNVPEPGRLCQVEDVR